VYNENAFFLVLEVAKKAFGILINVDY